MAKGTLITFCFAVFISAAHCRFVRSVSNDLLYYQLDNGTVIVEDLSKPTAQAQAFKADDVTLYLYTQQSGPNSPCVVRADSCDALNSCGFDQTQKTEVIIHGYTGSYDAPGVQAIKNAYLAKTKVNVIIADYKPVSSPYLVAVSSAKNVGQTAAKTVAFLQANCGVDPKKTQCVGHSLGAHICGLFSAALPEKCPRIVALDPAEPIITLYGNDNKLDISDADNLQNIHTSSQGLGETSAFGDIDFYPNGARDQYSCGSGIGQILAGGCDHVQACPLFADTILHPNSFKTDLVCDSDRAALAKSCRKGPVTTTLGEYNNRLDTGIYLIETDPIYKAISTE